MARFSGQKIHILLIAFFRARGPARPQQHNRSCNFPQTTNPGQITFKEFYHIAADLGVDELRAFLFTGIEVDLSLQDGIVPKNSIPESSPVGNSNNFPEFLVNFLFHMYYWKINVLVFETGREMLKPGMQLKTVALALNRIYEQYGVLNFRTFGYGHSFGVLSHYYGRETILEIREDNELSLGAGMVVSMEPHITIPEEHYGAGGYREHDILLIKSDGGNENLTCFQ